MNWFIALIVRSSQWYACFISDIKTKDLKHKKINPA